MGIRRSGASFWHSRLKGCETKTAYNMMQGVSIDYVVGSHRKREDSSMMIFMDRTGQEDEERTFAVEMDDIPWDEDQDETTMEPL